MSRSFVRDKTKIITNNHMGTFISLIYSIQANKRGPQSMKIEFCRNFNKQRKYIKLNIKIKLMN